MHSIPRREFRTLPYNVRFRTVPGLAWESPCGRKPEKGSVHNRMLWLVILWMGVVHSPARWTITWLTPPDSETSQYEWQLAGHDRDCLATYEVGATWLSASWGSSASPPSGSSLCLWHADPGCTCPVIGSARGRLGLAFLAPHWRHVAALGALQTWSSHSRLGWSCVLHALSASSSVSETGASGSPWQIHLHGKWRKERHHSDEHRTGREPLKENLN